MNVLPGSPAQVILGTAGTPQSVHALTVKLGLNEPLWTQYAHWMGGLLSGRLGVSYISQQPIAPELGRALETTAVLVGLALLVAIVVAVPLGVMSALWHRRAAGTGLSVASQLGIAVPNFVAGILLLTLFAVHLHWFPANDQLFPQESFGPALRSLVLPAIALGLAEGAILSRFIRSGVVDVLRSDFLRTARAKGLRQRQALLRHGLRNGALPVMTVLGLQLAGLVVGAVVVESVFSLPGLGQLLVQEVNNHDLIVVQDIVILIAAVVLIVNLLVDISYRVIDPRVGLDGAGVQQRG
jgi:peptide/nickel transport system permease protein